VTDSNIDYQVSLFSRYSDLQFKPDYAGDLMFNGLASNLNRSSFSNGLQGDFSLELDDKNTLRSGFFASNDLVKSASKNWVFAVDANGDQTSNDPFQIDENSAKNSQLLGAYLQNEWKAADKLTVNYGARFDISRSYVNESQFSPRFGAVYDLTKATKIHAGFSRYFTPPPTALISRTTLDKFQNTSNAAENLQNDKVRSERTNYYDVGLSHKFSPHLTFGLDGYYKQIKNLLDEGQFGNAPIYTPFNYQSGKAYGLEFKADYTRDKFSSYFNFATQNASGKNVVSGQYLLGSDELAYIANKSVTLDHVQTYTASIGASYLLRQTKYSADAIYGSGLRTGSYNLNTMPAYLQVNASASRDFDLLAAGKINLRLSMLNLFDEVYQFSNGSGIGVAASQYGVRRTLYLTASKSF
jgi:outer membrane receptor protein involved in Fe transport